MTFTRTTRKLPKSWEPDVPLYPCLEESNDSYSSSRSNSRNISDIARCFVTGGRISNKHGNIRVAIETDAESLLDVVPNSSGCIEDSLNPFRYGFSSELERKWVCTVRARHRPEPGETCETEKGYIYRTVIRRELSDHDPALLLLNLDRIVTRTEMGIVNEILEAYGITDIGLIKANTRCNQYGRNWTVRIGNGFTHPYSEQFTLADLNVEMYGVTIPTLEERKGYLERKYESLRVELAEAKVLEMNLKEYREFKILSRREGIDPISVVKEEIEKEEKLEAIRNKVKNKSRLKGTGIKFNERVSTGTAAHTISQAVDKMLLFEEFRYCKRYTLEGVKIVEGDVKKLDALRLEGNLNGRDPRSHYGRGKMEVLLDNIKIMEWYEVNPYGHLQTSGTVNRTGRYRLFLPKEPDERIRRFINNTLKKAGRKHFQLKLDPAGAANGASGSWKVKINYPGNDPFGRDQLNGLFEIPAELLGNGQGIEVDPEN